MKVIDPSVKLPRKLTAANGAKCLLMGEFFVDIIGPCDECSEYGDEFASDCESCGGTGEVKYQLAIPWTTIKDIYAKIVCHFGEEIK